MASGVKMLGTKPKDLSLTWNPGDRRELTPTSFPDIYMCASISNKINNVTRRFERKNKVCTNCLLKTNNLIA